MSSPASTRIMFEEIEVLEDLDVPTAWVTLTNWADAHKLSHSKELKKTFRCFRRRSLSCLKACPEVMSLKK